MCLRIFDETILIGIKKKDKRKSDSITKRVRKCKIQNSIDYIWYTSLIFVRILFSSVFDFYINKIDRDMLEFLNWIIKCRDYKFSWFNVSIILITSINKVWFDNNYEERIDYNNSKNSNDFEILNQCQILKIFETAY